MRVDVEIQEGLNFGRTVCDLYGGAAHANARVAVGVDDEAFFKLLLDRIATLG